MNVKKIFVLIMWGLIFVGGMLFASINWEEHIRGAIIATVILFGSGIATWLITPQEWKDWLKDK